MKILLALSLLLMTTDAAAQSRRRGVGRPAPEPPPRIVTVHDDFRFGQLGWEHGFADYGTYTEYSSFEFDAGIRPLPPELGISGTGFFITGHNRSDDLFMFLTKKLTTADGVRPNQQYEISFRVVFASHVGDGDVCGGIGGAPGASVFLKVGAVAEQPRPILIGDHYRMNVDKGNQSQGGPAATVAGSIENGTKNCSADSPFFTVVRSHRHSFSVSSNAAGEIWLLVGTDSGFEGKTLLYYQSIEAVLTPAS